MIGINLRDRRIIILDALKILVMPRRIASRADKAKKLLPKEITSDTVHKFQGREQDVIIMTTVIDSSLAGQRGLRFVDDPCLINVAVSRASKTVYALLADDTLFQQRQAC